MTLRKYTREFKRNFSLAIPVMLGYLGHVLVGMMDNIFVGWLDPINLAAISLANSAIFFIMSFGIGFSYAITPLVSEAMGSNKPLRLKKILHNGLFLNTLLGILMAALSMGIPYFLRIAHQPEEVIVLAIPYVRIVGISLLFVMIFQAFKQFSDGLGLTKYPMLATLIANLLNVTISYALVFGKAGMPRMGIYGAAYGTLIARGFMIISIWGFMYYAPKTSVYMGLQEFVKKKILSYPVIKRLLYLGIPSGFQGVFEMGFFSATVWIAGSLGAVAQAANQIALQIASLTFMVFIGFGVAATIRIGNQKGRRDYIEMRRIALSIFLQVFIFELVFTLLMIAFRHQLPHLFLTDYDNPEKWATAEEIYLIAVKLLVVVGIFQISDGFQVTIQGALRGLQDVIYPFYITLFSYWIVGFPISWFLSKRFGPEGIWYGLLTGLSLAAVLLGWRFHRLTKKLKRENPAGIHTSQY